LNLFRPRSGQEQRVLLLPGWAGASLSAASARTRPVCGCTRNNHREGACRGQKRPAVRWASCGRRRGAVEGVRHLIDSSPGGRPRPPSPGRLV